VRDVSFDLHTGEIIALVGHNGAGKTTLLKLMLGLVRPSAGTIRVLGEDPAAGEFVARRRLGYLPENVSFNAALTGREVLSFYARLKEQPVALALSLLDQVGLGAASQRRIGTYSKGMRQRLGLAQALIGEPQVLLLDEPTTGLDPALRLEFYEIVEKLRSRGATVVLSSHALAELGERAGRVIIMNQGATVANGSLDGLRHLARLPSKIRLTVVEGAASGIPNWLGALPNWRQVNGHIVEIDAVAEDKIELLRRVTGAGAPVVDIDVMPPTLDEIYAHFLQRGAAQ
jgi:Cu-processing system ATP-binding protein